MSTFSYGRLAPHDPRTHPRLRLRDFLRPGDLPPIPATVDYLSSVLDWPKYLNDVLGDCTVAAVGHMIEAFTQYGQGQAVEITDNDVLAAYEAVSGYRPGHPRTDRGAVMQDVLNYWRKTGVGGHKIAAFAELDIKNADEIQAALYLFGHVYVGFNVPASAETQFDQGKDWDVVAHDGGILGGHAVNVGARDSATKVRLITWGSVQGMTKAFWDKYVDEAWIAVSLEWINANYTNPQGINVAALGAAFTTLTGQPSPFPTPVPPPVGPVATVADKAFAVAARAWLPTAVSADDAVAVIGVQAWLTKMGL